MFILYQSADGTNVTVSPRTASGHDMPQYDSSAQITLLEGSGVNGSQMVANIKCSSCSGNSDFSGSSASWIHATKSGSPIKSDDQSESIAQHGNGYGSFNWDYSNAKGGSSVNPFASSNAVSTGGAATGNAAGDSSSSSLPNSVLLAHAVMASLAFLVLFPTGAILIRLASFMGLIWVHAALQALAYVIYIVAFGMGVWLAVNGGYIAQAHPIIGIVLFIVLLAQPLGGWLHHRNSKKYGRRTAPSYAHIGIGRAAIILGMINGGLGLQLARDTTTGHIVAYAVVAGVFGLAYIVAIIMGERKRKKNQGGQGERSTEKGPPSDKHSQQEHRLSLVGSSEPTSPSGSGRE